MLVTVCMYIIIWQHGSIKPKDVIGDMSCRCTHTSCVAFSTLIDLIKRIINRSIHSMLVHVVEKKVND